MLRTIARCSTLLCILWMSACAVKPQKTQNLPLYAAGLTHWKIEGKLGVRLPHEAHSANITWHNEEPNYRIQLFGPFGKGKVDIKKDSGIVTLRDKDQVLTATSAEALLQQISGINMPVHLLEYWVRGLPAPTTVENIQTNQEGLVTQFNQENWRITYVRHAPVYHLLLPEKIVLQQDDYKLTLIIKKWSIEPPSNSSGT